MKTRGAYVHELIEKKRRELRDRAGAVAEKVGDGVRVSELSRQLVLVYLEGLEDGMGLLTIPESGDA